MMTVKVLQPRLSWQWKKWKKPWSPQTIIKYNERMWSECREKFATMWSHW
jgi:hypothetical protein